MREITEFLTSGSWYRIVIDVVLLYLSVRAAEKRPRPAGTMLIAVPVVLILRDLVDYFTVSRVPMQVAALVIMGLYFVLTSAYEPRVGTMIRGVILCGIGVIVAVMGGVLDAPSWLTIVVDGYVIVLVAALSFAMNNITLRSSAMAGEILAIRYRLNWLLFFSYFVILWFSHELPVSQYVLMPLLSLPYFAVVVLFLRMDRDNQRWQTEVTREYINSIFHFMENIGTAMTARLDVEQVLDYVLESIISSTPADAGAALLVDEYQDVLKVRSVRGFYPPPYEVPQVAVTKTGGIERYFRSTPIALGETILGEAVTRGEPIHIRNAALDPRMTINQRDDALYVSSIIILPLVVEDRILGVMSVVCRTLGTYFDDNDFDRCRVFAKYASLTLENLNTYIEILEKREIEQEVGIAAEIQQKLVPTRVPSFGGSEIAAYTQPARGVSGDYFDVIPLNGSGKCALVICDVAGKGVPASLVMVMIRTIIHLIASDKRSAKAMVTWINRGIAGQIDIDRFATLSVVTFDPETRSLTYANAAHHPALVLRSASGQVEKLDTEGLPIGLERQGDYGETTTTLQPGDLVMLYTDGIVEALNAKNEQYDEERLFKAFLEHGDKPPSTIVEAIKSDVQEFVGGAKQHDDQTLLVLKAV